EPVLDAAGQPLQGADGQPLMQDKSGQTQSIALAPVASQLAIKMLGTNGGGFFNANSAHPFATPSAATNALQMLSILLIP
ncbi:potassium-transporting ATPase subunit KdpA, partial [Klebsiella pneumoniae]|uniref:potassium-transporting ATPase subunit KdpA n=1 Tax=Klebsiella pneumoniae TaxID=573 RepID=UPI00273111EB